MAKNNAIKRGFVATAIFLVVAISLLTLHSSLPVSATEVSVEPIMPSVSVVSKNQVELTTRVHGAQPGEYEMFWAAGNGQWNRMTTDTTSGISRATIDTSEWTWSRDGNYPVRFIALIKNTQQNVERSVTLHKPTSSTHKSLSTVRTAAPLAKPLARKKLFTDSDTVVARQQAQKNDPATRYIASQPTAKWFGGWNQDIAGDVAAYMQRAETAQMTPVIALYNIPQRDCGSYSAGGAASYQAYNDWVKQIASSISGRSVIAIIEPDAIADMSCLTQDEKAKRNQAIADSITTLGPNAQTYIDAGNPTWHTAPEIAKRLKNAGVAKATGFSLNVSNFQTTDSNVSYGTKISKLTNGKHFVVDTSRNGNGSAPGNAWCNPPGRALGNAPTLSTGKSLVDAYLWVKAPGESDGTCGNGAPIAGEWWQSYADALYRNQPMH